MCIVGMNDTLAGPAFVAGAKPGLRINSRGEVGGAMLRCNDWAQNDRETIAWMQQQHTCKPQALMTLTHSSADRGGRATAVLPAAPVAPSGSAAATMLVVGIAGTACS